MPKWEPIRQWTHEEIWDMILNGGRNANPDDVPMKTFDPTQKADYYAEGIKYDLFWLHDFILAKLFLQQVFTNMYSGPT